MTITKEMVEAAAQAAYHASCANADAYMRPWRGAGEITRVAWRAIAKAALEAAERAAWQPIGPDAKTGDDVHLGCFGERSCNSQFIAFWGDEDGDQLYHWRTDDGAVYCDDLPTHWRPLPSPADAPK
jgi:hypothetical protein